MRRLLGIIAGILAVAASCVTANAQSIGCPYPLQYGQVLTTAQWNACLGAGLSALPITGGTLTGPLDTASATTSQAGLNVPYGSAPTSPNPGDVYNAADGLRVYDNGAWNLLVGTQTASPAQGDIIYFNGTKWVDLAPGTSGYFLETLGAGANPQWASASGGSGCTISGGSQYQIIVNNGSSGCSTSANASVNVGALSLGASGTLGSVKMGNATSGTLTLQPTTGALGTITATLPANSGTISELNLAQVWTAAQTLPNSGLLLLGSSTGATTFTSANVSASNYTITIPAATDTMMTLAAGQVVTNKTISGSSNTLSNIANGSLTNSAITINGTSVSLGGSTTISIPSMHSQVFLSNGIFTAPAGTISTTTFKFIVTAGGGDSTSGSNGGGAGATGILYASGLTAGQTVNVVVGGHSTTGGSSSITIGSTTYTATGGANTTAGGSATGFTINLNGGAGANGGGVGGSSYWGGGADIFGFNVGAYGSGGINSRNAGNGIVSVEWTL